MGRFRYAGRSTVVDRIVRLAEIGQIGQPFLFTGPEGCGKDATAREIARRVNCVDPARCSLDDPCESCAKADTFQHPDIQWIGPAPASIDEKGVRQLLEAKAESPFHQAEFAASSQILIGDPDDPGPLTIRSVIRVLRRQAFQARWKVAIVSDAQRMNPAAANAFLKTLEEPPPRSLIILTATGTAGLLPTILSRCQRIGFEPLPAPELAPIIAALAPDQAEAAAVAARLADGNARRALALLGPEAQAVWDWSTRTFTALAERRHVDTAVVAELLSSGLLPVVDEAGAVDLRTWEAKDLTTKRRRCLLFCELLAQCYAEAAACQARGDAWEPRAPRMARPLRQGAAALATGDLLAGIARIEAARAEVEGNLNPGVVMAALFKDLGSHAGRDAAAAR